MKPHPEDIDDLIRRILELPQERRGALSGETQRMLYAAQWRMGEADRIDARTRGRNVAPTDAEIKEHWRKYGAWLVTWSKVEVVRQPAALRKLAARCRKYSLPVRWVPITAGGTLADWPQPPEAATPDETSAAVARKGAA